MTRSEPQGWDWIGLTNEEGNLHVPAAARHWSAPREVKVKGGRLFYDYMGSPPQMPRRVSPGPELLSKFLLLDGASATEIVSFAKRWGVLGLCRHGLMYPHEALYGARRWNRQVNCFPGRIKRSLVGPDYPGIYNYWLWEPLESWWRYVKTARAMLNVVAELRLGHPGRREDWLVLTPIPPNEAEGNIEKNPWRYIDRQLRDWFSPRPVTLSFEINEKGDLKLGLTRAATSLLEYLRLQLAFAIGRGGGLALCAACGQLYTPNRRPNPNRSAYCLKCGRRAAMRFASMKYRQKKGGAG
jgi:hypothetical protein